MTTTERPASPHPEQGCIDGFLPVNPIIRQPSATPCPMCESDKAIRAEARRTYHRYGEIEIDENAIVSRGDEDGAYVAAWVWVELPECDNCGKRYDPYGDGYAGRCPPCADEAEEGATA